MAIGCSFAGSGVSNLSKKNGFGRSPTHGPTYQSRREQLRQRVECEGLLRSLVVWQIQMEFVVFSKKNLYKRFLLQFQKGGHNIIAIIKKEEKKNKPIA